MPVMQVKYILLRKPNAINKDSKQTFYLAPFKEMFNALFSNVTENSFEIQISKTFYTVKYVYSSKSKGSTCYLSLQTEGTSSRCAMILNEANRKMTKGIHRKDYIIILSFDGVSLYYCNKVYPKFNLFERKIRELIFCILVKSFGINWYEATVKDSLKAELEKQTKGMKQSELIERALYEMTVYQLETYLFIPYRDLDANNLVDGELSESVINEKTKKEIIETLNKSRAKSLWDRFFEKSVKINDLHSSLESIRAYRNCVAHSKYFYEDDYIKCNQVLNKLLRQIDSAIFDIEIRTFSKTDVSESLGALAGTFGLFYKGIADAMTPAIGTISNLLAHTTQVKIPKFQFDIPILNAKVMPQFDPIAYALRVNANLTPQFDSIADALKVNANTTSQFKLAADALRVNANTASQFKLAADALRVNANTASQFKLAADALRVNANTTSQFKLAADALRVNANTTSQFKLAADALRVNANTASQFKPIADALEINANIIQQTNPLTNAMKIDTKITPQSKVLTDATKLDNGE